MESKTVQLNNTFALQSSDEDPFSLERVINTVFYFGTHVNIQQLLQLLQPHVRNMKTSSKEYHKLYMRLYRRIQKLKDLGVLEVKKTADGLLWVGLTQQAINLIQQARNSNQREKPIESIFNLPKRARPERIEAIKEILTVKMLNSEKKERLQDLFEEYLDYVDGRVIILRRNIDAPEDVPPFFIVPYVTRYTDDAIKVNNLKKYERIWEIASQRYKYAVFLTLTTDPKRFKSLWHSYRHFAVAFNRFMSYLRKQFGFRPHYIAVYEFTESGLMHVHVCLFGIKILMHYRKISEVWSRHGQGQIIYVYRIQYDGHGWHWVKKRPKDAKKGESAADYLKKYLKKALFKPEGLSLYWVSNKRFFTYSRFFSQYFSKKPEPLGWYVFFGTFKIFEIPMWVLTPETYISYRVTKEYPEIEPPPT